MALKEANQIQSDESLRWGMSAIEDNEKQGETLD